MDGWLDWISLVRYDNLFCGLQCNADRSVIGNLCPAPGQLPGIQSDEGTMTTKERAIQVIERLPADATLDEIKETLEQLEPGGTAEPEPPLAEGGVWDLLEHSAGTVEMPADWASEHDHLLYGTPKRSSAA